MSAPTIPNHEHVCCMCGRSGRGAFTMPAQVVRPQIAEHIARAHPDRWTPTGRICHACLNRERLDFVTERLIEEKGALSGVEEEVAKKAGLHLTIARNIDQQFRDGITFGQHAADGVARVGGSWTFVISFIVFLCVWMATNTFVLRQASFDPYPYILLNLVLSCLAALQAPIIMMSQNRQGERDRLESTHDYETDLKAEIEIASLHDKIDHLLHAQWERMVDLQEMQIDLLTEIAGRPRRR
jgi:uncharacterized membrane protein